MRVPALSILVLGLAAVPACSSSNFASSSSKKAADKGGSAGGTDGATDKNGKGGNDSGSTGGSTSGGTAGGSDSGSTAGGSDSGSTAGGTAGGSDSGTTAGSDQANAANGINVDEGQACDPKTFLIDFETLPDTGQAPTENMDISDQFKKKFGVTFSLDGGALPSMAKVDSGKSTAYSCNSADCSQGGGANGSGSNNGLRPGQGAIGKWFLKGANGQAFVLNPAPLNIIYDKPTASLGGNIMDIDGSEKWTIQAIDEGGNVIDKVELDSPDPNGAAADGKPTPFSFKHDKADIKQLKLIGHSTGAFGLGFDNFSTRGVCPGDKLPTPP